MTAPEPLPADRRAALKTCLLGLVLLNLVFVHITGVVARPWLIALYGLTAAAPLFAAYHDRLWYRTFWTMGVFGIFVVLVHDATASGVRFMLEDGLILAAFCQVHLLNNLGPRQKPDLLFFNSFLIAVVTSFFCQDLVYAAVLAAYGYLLTVTMLLDCAVRHGAGALPGLSVDGAFKAGGILSVTLVAFLVVPRDFDREGLLSNELMGGAMAEVGYSDEVVLGRTEQAVVSNRVVMRVRLLKGKRQDVPAHWRGSTFAWYGSGRWHPVKREQGFGPDVLDPLWLHRSATRWVRPGQDSLAHVAVELDEGGPGPLFAPLESHFLELDEGGDAPSVAPLADGTISSVPHFSPSQTRVGYRLRLRAGQHDYGDETRHPRRRSLMSHQAIDHRDLPARGVELAAEIAAETAGQPQHRVVERMRGWLASSFDYLLPGTRGAAADLGEFLSGEAGGHCEYFATALALMLRSEGIPCRLVTGYCSQEWDEVERILTIRSRHGHAWVEVRDPAGFWYTVDPTPATGVDQAAGASRYDSVAAWLRNGWDRIAAFDAEARGAAIVWARALPGRLARWCHDSPMLAVALVVALAALWRARWLRRRRGIHPAILAYRTALRRAGLQSTPGETPRELLDRARHSGVRPDRLERLVAATVDHELQRYGIP